MPGMLLGHPLPSDGAELVVHEWEEFVCRVRIAAFDSGQNAFDLGGCVLDIRIAGEVGPVGESARLVRVISVRLIRGHVPGPPEQIRTGLPRGEMLKREPNYRTILFRHQPGNEHLTVSQWVARSKFLVLPASKTMSESL